MTASYRQIDKRNLGVLTLICCFLVSYCTTLSEDSADNLSSGDLNYEDFEEQSEIIIKHPAKTTAFQTLTLISTTPQPATAEVHACQQNLSSLAKEINNLDDMVIASANLSPSIQAQPETYHWCFYQTMVRLDQRLEMGGPLMSDLATIFFSEMRSLWIQAMAMDKYFETKIYFNYLRDRYVQLSKQYFGRHLRVMGSPLMFMTTKQKEALQSRDKSAESFEQQQQEEQFYEDQQASSNQQGQQYDQQQYEQQDYQQQNSQ